MGRGSTGWRCGGTVGATLEGELGDVSEWEGLGGEGAGPC